MKKVLLFVLAALCLVACNNGTSGSGKLESATLSKTTLELTEGATYRLTVNPTPEDAVIESVTWSSSDEMVASVSENGTVSANSLGTATISAAIVGTDIVAKCQVTVKSLLEATVFDQIAIFGADSDTPYDIVMQKNDGTDTVCQAITAQFAMLPSTMYIDGEGYMAGDGGYVMWINTAFLIDEAAQSWICLAEYDIVSNVLNDKGQFKPWKIQTGHFNKDNYEEYWTLYIIYANGQSDVQPESSDYPYYDGNDSYFLRAFAAEDGISLLDGGYPTTVMVGEEEQPGFIYIDQHATESRLLAPKYYSIEAKLFDNANNLGFAIEEQVTEDGETQYVFVDKNEDNKFDLAEMIDFTFEGGEIPTQQAPAAKIMNAKSIPAKAGIKNIAINKAMHVALRMNVR